MEHVAWAITPNGNPDIGTSLVNSVFPLETATKTNRPGTNGN
jgi:hypothetical protein